MSISEDRYVELMREILLAEPYRGVCTEPTRLLDHVYIGSQSNAESLRLLRQLRITYVLNCAGYKGPRPVPNASPYEGLGIDYYEFQAEDTDSYDICRHFPEAFRYIDRVKRQGGTVLVHCALGINRSAAVCLGYLMTSSKIPLLQATRILKDKRRIALANRGFQRQLVRFARSRGLLDKLEPGRDEREEEERRSSWSDGDRISALIWSAKSDLLGGGGGGSSRQSHRLLSTDSPSLRPLPPRYQVVSPRHTSNGPLSAPRSSGIDDARWRDRRSFQETINGVSTVGDLLNSGCCAMNGRSRTPTVDRKVVRSRRAQSSPRSVNGVRPVSPMNDRRLGSESYVSGARARALEFRY